MFNYLFQIIFFHTAEIMFKVRPGNKTDVQKGSSFFLSCKAYSNPSLPIKYKWLHKGKETGQTGTTYTVATSGVSMSSQKEMRFNESMVEVRVSTKRFSTLMSWSNENKSCMRVDKREFVREFSLLSCPGQTRTKFVRFEKREMMLEFSQLLFPGQTKTEASRCYYDTTVHYRIGEKNIFAKPYPADLTVSKRPETSF